MTVEVLYLAWNRLEFTRATFELLLANTDWALVDRLVVYDDVSIDGTTDYLYHACERASHIEIEFNSEPHGGPVAVMAEYLLSSDPDWFAKIDNDIAVPPGWLEALLSVATRNPELELLGMESGMGGRPPDGWDGVYGWTPCSHIGGVGLMRTEAFARRRRLQPNGRFGFTEWQSEYRPVRGWVTPDVPVVALNLLPVDPWQQLSAGYRDAGWQRDWPGPYDARHPFWDWFTDDIREAA